jgi:membrane protein involved in colicin uptake
MNFRQLKLFLVQLAEKENQKLLEKKRQQEEEERQELELQRHLEAERRQIEEERRRVQEKKVTIAISCMHYHCSKIASGEAALLLLRIIKFHVEFRRQKNDD